MTLHYMFTIAIRNPDTMSDKEVEQFKEFSKEKVTKLFKPLFCNEVIVNANIISDAQLEMLREVP